MAAGLRMCPDQDWPIDLTTLAIAPDPPRRGDPLTETWTFSNSVAITAGARMHETWKVGAMTVRERDVDLCGVVAASGLTCPIQPGRRTLTYRYPTVGDDLPAIPPFVTINVRRVLINGDGQQLLCFETTLKFTP